MNKIRRLTKTFGSFIIAILGGRSYDYRGDSKTPFMRYEEQQFIDSEHLQYNNRHGLHLGPRKSVDKKVM